MIADFTEGEPKLVSTQLFKRYGKLAPLQPAATAASFSIPKRNPTAPAME